MVLKIKKNAFSSENFINIFIVCMLLLPTYIDLMGTLSAVIGFSTKITTYAYYGLMWLLLMLSVPRIAGTITWKVAFGLLMFAVFGCALFFIYPNNKTYLRLPALMDVLTFSPRSLPAVVPYILIGLAVNNGRGLLRMLHTGARVGVVCGFVSYLVAVLNKMELNYDDMANAYALCTVICVLIIHYQKHDGWFLLLGCASLLVAGTRGPILCVIVAVVVRILWLEKNKTKKILAVITGVLVMIVIQSSLLLGLLDLIEDGAQALGIQSLRVIDYVRDGALADSSGRDAIATTVVEAIKRNPLLGYGVGGDRYVLGRSRYAHNLALELWVSYGIPVGTAILGWMLACLLKGICGKNRDLRLVVITLSCSIAVKLLLSSSYLYEKELLVLLGMCMAGGKIPSGKIPEGNNEKSA